MMPIRLQAFPPPSCFICARIHGGNADWANDSCILPLLVSLQPLSPIRKQALSCWQYSRAVHQLECPQLEG